MKATESKSVLDQFTVVKRAVLYARTSSDDTERDSLTGQLEVGEAYANEKGYVIIARLKEDIRGVKGDDRSAPALNKALEMAQAGLYDVLIIRDVKRYSRDIYKAMDFDSRFFDIGIEIEYVWNQELNGLPRKGTGAMMRFLQYWMSEEDRRETVKKLYLARIGTVERKGSVIVNGRPPYGYSEQVITEGRTKRRILVINEVEAKWVRKIFEWYVYEGLGLRGIADKLKSLCVPRPSIAKPKEGVGRRGEFDWPQSTVREILTRRTYIGEWEYGKDIGRRRKNLKKSIIADDLLRVAAAVEVPAIIERALFEAVQEKLIERRKKTHRKSEHQFLFRGRVKCGLCGYACRCRVIKGGSNKLYFDYGCNERLKRMPHPETGEICTLPRLKRDIIDADTWDWLTQVMNDEEELRKGYQDYMAGKGAKIGELQAELKRIEKGIEEAMDKLTKQALALATLESIGSTHAVDIIKQDILQIEEIINRYLVEKARVEEELKGEAISVDFIKDFDTYIATIREGMRKAGKDFNKRLNIIEALDVSVVLTVENGQAVFYPRFRLRQAMDKPILYNHSGMIVQELTLKGEKSLIVQTRIIYRG